MIRICGASLGLLGFSIAVVQGLGAGNPADVVLVRAIWALVLMCGLGLLVGWVAHRVLDEHAVARHREMFKEIEEPSEAPSTDSQSPPTSARSTGPANPGNAPGRSAAAG